MTEYTSSKATSSNAPSPWPLFQPLSKLVNLCQTDREDNGVTPSSQKTVGIGNKTGYLQDNLMKKGKEKPVSMAQGVV